MRKKVEGLKKTETLMHRILHIMEAIIAILTLIVIIGMLGYEIYKMVTVQEYFSAEHGLNNYLHNSLTIVVGLEFVRMLIDMTPANTLEVLIMATARYVIMNHDSPVALLIGVLCVAILFAIRRFLIPRSDLTLDLVEIE